MKAPFPSLTETYHQTSYDAISPTRHDLSVAHKTIIITGGGRGLGPEIAKAYAAAGASHIVLIGRTQTTLSKSKETIEKEFSSVTVTTHIADVADEAAIGKAAEKVGKVGRADPERRAACRAGFNREVGARRLVARF